jgi:hypothetical protein
MGDLADFASDLLLGGAAGKTPPPDMDLAEGDLLVELFFSDDAGKQWCHRRVVSLRFLAARRGQWTTIVDFTLDKRFGEIAPLLDCDEVLIPLFTFGKDVMPPAHLRTADEKGHVLPLGSTRPSRLIECMMLIALAAKAEILDGALYNDLADLTDTDPRLATPSFERIGCHIDRHSAAIGAADVDRAQALVRFASAARVFYRSAILLLPFAKTAVEESAHKVVHFTYDAPVRLTKYAPELIGYSPLRVAPLTIFGGNAESYHVQLEPPDGVVVVNTRLLYAYTAREPRTRKPQFPKEDLEDQVLHELPRRKPLALGLSRLGLKSYDKGTPVVARPLSRHLLDAGWSRWWGTVLGSAEPMAAHVRVNAGKLPGPIEGRDVITMFQLYPDMSAFSGLIVGTLLNYAFLLALYLAVHGDLSLISPNHSEPLFIVGALIAGFGSGLALYRREHLITEQVASPWRLLFGVQVVMTMLSLAALLVHIDDGLTSYKRTEISCFFFVASAALAYLMAISARAGVAQRAGGRAMYGWQGFAPRRRWFRAHWYTDDLGEAPHSHWGAKRAKRLIRHTAEHYLNEGYRRELFNQGVPAASRHDPGSRGSTRSWG